jgi:hypothetical protein
MSKVCAKCKNRQPTSEFHKDSLRPDGLRSSCKSCAAEYHARNRDARNATMSAQQRKRQRSAKYGIAESVGLELRARPCDICGAPPASGKGGTAIDHCGETGAVRGSLCMSCNTGIGKLQHSPEILSRAIHYLTRGADYRTVDREDES